MTPSALQQLVTQNHDKAEQDHKRLRGDVDAIGGKVASIQTVQTDLLLRVTTLERMPINVDKVSFSGRQLATIIGACVVLAGGMWQLRVGINDVQTAVANAAKLQDERNATQKETLDNLGRQIEMRRVEIQRVRDDLAEYIRSKPKEPR